MMRGPRSCGPRPCGAREPLWLRMVIEASGMMASRAELLLSTVAAALLCGRCSWAAACLMVLMLFAARGCGDAAD